MRQRSVARWLQSLLTSRPNRTGSSRARPFLEVLEDRLAPAAVQTITVGNASAQEGDATALSPSGVVKFTVTRSCTDPISDPSSPLNSTLDLDYRTVDGTARCGVDFVSTSSSGIPVNTGPVHFNAGQTSATVAIQLIGNTTPELNRTFSIQVFNPIKIPDTANAQFGLDVDAPPPPYPNQPVDTNNGQTPRWVSFGDFNGDGKKDMATANLNSPDIEVLMNTTPTGTALPTYNTYPFDTNQPTDASGNEKNPSRASLAVANLFGHPNGKMDIVTADNDNHRITVFKNTTPTGAAVPTFTVASYSLANNEYPLFLAIADFNRDGRLDIAFGNFGSDTIGMLLQQPGGTFGSEITISSGVTPRPGYLWMGDINGDLKPDLVVGSWGNNSTVTNTVTVLLNTFSSGGTSATFTATQLTGGENPMAVALADVNGDGKLDVVAGMQGKTGVTPVYPDDDTVWVWLSTTAAGASSATFATPWKTPTFIDQAYDPKTGTQFNNSGSKNSWIRSIAVNDLNGDGRPDITLSLRDTDRVSILLNQTVKGSNKPDLVLQDLLYPGNSPRSVAWGDSNGDGKLDLAVTSTGNSGTYSERVSIFLNATADVTFTSYQATGTIIDDDTPTAIAILGSGSFSTVVNTVFAPGPQVVVTNTHGDGVNGVTVLFTAPKLAISGVFGPNVYQSSAATDPFGQASTPTLTATTKAGGPWTLTASVNGVKLTPVTFSMTNTPDVPAQLIFLTQPTDRTYMTTPQSFSPDIKVGYADQYGNTVNGSVVDGTSVNMALLDSTGTDITSHLVGTLIQTTTGGAATFPGLGVDEAGAKFRLEANTLFSGTAISGLSNAFNVRGPATQLSVGIPPVLLIHQTYTFTVQALDQFGALAASSPPVAITTSTPGVTIVPKGSSQGGAVQTFSIVSHTAGKGTMRLSATFNGKPFTLDVVFYTVFGSRY